MTAPAAREIAPRDRILEHPVDAVGKVQAAEALIDRALNGPGRAYVCLTNVHTTVESQRSAEVRAAADSAFLSVPDGIPLAWILRRRGYTWTEKITGIEFMPLVAALGRDVGLRHFFYGGEPGVAAAAARRLCELVPGTEVVGTLTPPFATLDDWPLEKLQDELRARSPHVLWVGLGAPKQELWMAKMAGVLDVPAMVGVGAGFDFLAGVKRPAPAYLRHVGMEWLFRLASEPRRLWRRYLLGNATFVYLLARNALSGRRNDLERRSELDTPDAEGKEGNAR